MGVPILFQPISPDVSPIFARFMDDRSPWDVSRAASPDAPLWDALVSEVGAASLLIAEDHGGQGATMLELAAAVAETGRCGWSGPLVATAGVAVWLLRSIDEADASGLQSAIAEEGVVVVAALHEDARGESLSVAARLEDVDGVTRLNGRKTFVESGMHADVFLVPARDAQGRTVVARVAADADGVTRTPMDSVDPGRGLATIEFAGAQADVVSPDRDATDAVRDAWLVGALLTSVDLLGAALRSFTLARDYSLVREQFGRPVASFQSIKHKLVDMYGELQTAYSAVLAAIEAASAESDWRFAASAAKVRAGDAAMEVLRESVQVHGGIGFTWEHEISHHFRRVVAGRALYGTPTRHRELVAAASGF